MILEISVVILLVLLLTLCYVIWNLNTKQEMLEDWITNFMEIIERIDFNLKQIDYMGSFEADDETGIIFDEIKNIIKQLEPLKKAHNDCMLFLKLINKNITYKNNFDSIIKNF